MRKKTFKDPILEEVRIARHQLDKEYEKDPKAFMDRAAARALELGFKIVPDPHSLPKKPRKKAS